jgi:hypothetical protein
VCLPSSIVACVFISAGTYLPSRCLAMNVCSGSAVPAFSRHVVIYFNYFYELVNLIFTPVSKSLSLAFLFLLRLVLNQVHSDESYQ